MSKESLKFYRDNPEEFGFINSVYNTDILDETDKEKRRKNKEAFSKSADLTEEEYYTLRHEIVNDDASREYVNPAAPEDAPTPEDFNPSVQLEEAIPAQTPFAQPTNPSGAEVGEEDAERLTNLRQLEREEFDPEIAEQLGSFGLGTIGATKAAKLGVEGLEVLGKKTPALAGLGGNPLFISSAANVTDAVGGEAARRGANAANYMKYLLADATGQIELSDIPEEKRQKLGLSEDHRVIGPKIMDELVGFGETLWNIQNNAVTGRVTDKAGELIAKAGARLIRSKANPEIESVIDREAMEEAGVRPPKPVRKDLKKERDFSDVFAEAFHDIEEGLTNLVRDVQGETFIDKGVRPSRGVLSKSGRFIGGEKIGGAAQRKISGTDAGLPKTGKKKADPTSNFNENNFLSRRRKIENTLWESFYRKVPKSTSMKAESTLNFVSKIKKHSDKAANVSPTQKTERIREFLGEIEDRIIRDNPMQFKEGGKLFSSIEGSGELNLGAAIGLRSDINNLLGKMSLNLGADQKLLASFKSAISEDIFKLSSRGQRSQEAYEKARRYTQETAAFARLLDETVSSRTVADAYNRMVDATQDGAQAVNILRRSIQEVDPKLWRDVVASRIYLLAKPAGLTDPNIDLVEGTNFEHWLRNIDVMEQNGALDAMFAGDKDMLKLKLQYKRLIKATRNLRKTFNTAKKNPDTIHSVIGRLATFDIRGGMSQAVNNIQGVATKFTPGEFEALATSKEFIGWMSDVFNTASIRSKIPTDDKRNFRRALRSLLAIEFDDTTAEAVKKLSGLMWQGLTGIGSDPEEVGL